MLNGSDCTLRLKTKNTDTLIPFLSATLREKILFGEEYAPVEGDGRRGGFTESAGAAGGFTTALTLESSPAILGAMFGRSVRRLYVSGTRDLYLRTFGLCPSDEAVHFYLHERRGDVEKIYPECFCKGFELRIARDGTVKAHLDIDGNEKAETRNVETAERKVVYTERFNERGVEYFINGEKYSSIYRFVMSRDKSNGRRTRVLISRYLNTNGELPAFIENLTVKANLFRDIYEEGRYGRFAITMTDLRLLSDETEVCAADAVIGGLRYSVGGTAEADTFMNGTGAYDDVLSD
jgi:hypothetical protein